MQVEELKRRLGETGEPRVANGVRLSEISEPPVSVPLSEPALEPPPEPEPNVFTVLPGMTMAEIERGAIEAALRETGGNRRKAAELLGIGERTMYRKLREYHIPDGYAALD
jgi:DNA-binding NtrC family response regulator